MDSIRSQIKYIGAFPSDENPTELKSNPEYGCAYAEAIWAAAQAGVQSFNFSNQAATIKRNRKFARGMHEVEEYKPRAIAGTTSEFSALDYSITTPLPKFMRILKENIYSHQYVPKVKPYRSHVKTKYDEMKDRLIGEMLVAAEVRKLIAEGLLPKEMGLKNKVIGSPQNMEELEEKMDTEFVVLEAIALQELVSASMKKNEIQSIERLIISDLVENNKIAVRCYMDENYNFKIESVDILNMVTSYCENDDFSDMTHVGHSKFIKTSEFIDLAKQAGISDAQIIDIVKENLGRQTNKSNFNFGNQRYFNEFTDSQMREFNNLTVQVFHFEALLTDMVSYKEKELNTGGFDIRKTNSRYSTPEDAPKKAKAIKGQITKLYEGTWVVGTKIMLNWGLRPNVIRKIRNGKYVEKPCFSYIIHQPGMLDMHNVSLTEEVISHVEQIIIGSIKLQHFIALASPPGYNLDISGIATTLSGLGMPNATPLTLAQIKRELGVSFFSSTNDSGEQIMSQRVIENAPSGFDQGIEIILGIINHHTMQVRDILGLNDSVDATQPKERAAVKNMQMAYAAHKASLKPIQDVYLSVMSDIAERAAYANQMAIQAGKETEEVKQLLTEDELANLKLVEIGELLFNMEIAMMPDSYQKDMLKAKIDFGLQQGTIDIEDAMLLDRLIEENPENAEIVFRRKKKEKERRMMELEQQRAEIAAQIEQQKAQALAEIEEMKGMKELEREQMKKDLDMRNMIKEYEEKTKYLVTELDGKKEMIELQARLQEEQSRKEAVTQGIRPGIAEPTTDVSPRPVV